jgi:hypothetical protein
MGRACGAYVGGERHIQVLVGKHEGKKSRGDPGIDGRIILTLIFRN